MHPVAAADASHISRNRSRIRAYSSSRGERTMNQAFVRLGDDVGRRPALLDDPVDAPVRAELLAPQADRVEQEDERVERVPAHPRLRGRVRLAAVERDVDVLAGEQPALDAGDVRRVEQERGVEAFEQAVADHDPLARAALLGRRPEEDDLAGQLGRDRGQGDRGADPRGGHRVVAAAVPETRQRVVLGEDPDPRAIPSSSAAEDAPDGRRQAADRVVHRVAMPANCLGHPGRRLASPRMRAPGWRGSGATARGSRPDGPRRRRRSGASRRRTGRRGWWR